MRAELDGLCMPCEGFAFRVQLLCSFRRACSLSLSYVPANMVSSSRSPDEEPSCFLMSQA